MGAEVKVILDAYTAWYLPLVVFESPFFFAKGCFCCHWLRVMLIRLETLNTSESLEVGE